MNDYDVSIFIVTDDDVIYYPEYNKNSDGDARFIMLTNDLLNSEFGDDNTICISVHWNDFVGKRYIDERVFDMVFHDGNKNNQCKDEYGIEFVRLIWQADIQNIPGMVDSYDKIDFNGYFNTMIVVRNAYQLMIKHNEMIEQGRKLDYGKVDSVDMEFPAIMCAFNAIETYKGNNRHGYLPAIGQLTCISENLLRIDEILSDMSFEQIPITMMRRYPHEKLKSLYQAWWSSTQCDHTQVLYLNYGQVETDLFCKEKYICRILPLFYISDLI